MFLYKYIPLACLAFINTHKEHATILVIAKSIITVDNIRNCKYSQVLQMMGEDIARNM